ncbi:carbohydrate kinase [Paenibacillus sp. GCM10023248]|uniref:carbohydrate kinase family protein n=1 Tax=unclassified Paenibacillus TaxID=185978 RepID=UPI002379FE11|nr:carbohydrate kinase [Paenibacillus sp. MAHUQ-63]MDD9271668.1 carbohydrate kinase [Paenibacillus sp. MAHUQ-63]
MNYDVIAIGEFLIDFTPYGVSDAGQPVYERNPGGAPVNVAAAMAKLGGKSGFIGKVGADPFGTYLRQALLEYGITEQGLVTTAEAHTTMAFVQLDAQGERSFHFSRSPGADQLLREDEVNLALLEGARICHFGSISMTVEPACSATVYAVSKAKESGALISYDPNWRPSLWESGQQARKAIAAGLDLADLVKVSEEELTFLTGEADIQLASHQLAERHRIGLVLVTAGRAGSYYRLGSKWGKVDSFPVRTVDTTGAGDGFLGAFLYRVLQAGKPVQGWSEDELRQALTFANAAGALATTRKGAIPSLGTMAEIETLMQSKGEGV